MALKLILHFMKQLLMLSAVFFFLSGCKKGPEPFKNYFRFTVDGTKAINADLEIRASDPSINSLFIYGRWAGGELSIDLFNATLGERVVSSNFGSSPRFTLWEGQKTFYAGDNGISGGVTGSGRLNILEMSDQYVKGTFEFVTGINFTNEMRTVTNGEFHIKRGY